MSRIPQKYYKWIICAFGIYFVISAAINAYLTIIKLNGYKIKIPNDVSFNSIVSLEKCAKDYAEKYYDGEWRLVWITFGYNKDNLDEKMRVYFYYYDDSMDYNSDVRNMCTVLMNSETHTMQVRKSSDLKKKINGN